MDADYAAALRRTRRRVILEILLSADEEETSEIFLEPVLEKRRIYGSDRDAIRTDLTWLAAQGMVSTEEVGGALFARLLDYGAAIAKGKRSHPDVEKPPRRRA